MVYVSKYLDSINNDDKSNLSVKFWFNFENPKSWVYGKSEDPLLVQLLLYCHGFSAAGWFERFPVNLVSG